RFSRRYVERVNVNNTVIVNRALLATVYDNHGPKVPYRNRAVPGGVTVVSRTTFTSAQRVGGHRINMDQQLANADASARAPQIQPGRESRLGLSSAAAARRNVRVPPQAVASRQVVVKRNPPPSAAHFTRNAAQRDAMQDRRDERTPQSQPPVRLRTDRPPRANQPPAGEAVREPVAREPQQYQPRDTRQIELLQREQQQQRERESRQQPREMEQPRASPQAHVERSYQPPPQPAPQPARSQAEPRQAQPRQAEPRQSEPQHHSEQPKSAPSNPQPQKPQDRQARPHQRND
ncbi:MAG TPA: hypothetical protein VMS40_20735, partial [Vicinamibacterales bacterium]|nr:hypothetical protein [Vicinamibacterales bacterium]